VGREEACDDGNRIDGDGCNDSCHIEPPVCGDGRRDSGEDCDDGNAIDTDACLTGCRAAECGDGQMYELQEECDDGNEADGDGCSHDCKRETAPSGPRCGDGKQDADEACDDGNMSKADSCLVGCTFAACGDGAVRTGVEECDDAGSSKTCTRGCMLCGDTPGALFRSGNGHCYTVHDDAATEQQARATCQNEGGDLWTVTSDTEGSDVIERLSLTGRYWLGFLTGDTSNSWVSGEKATYTSFAMGEPRDAALRCVAFDATTPTRNWSSEACTSQLGFVCERSPAFVYPLDHHAYKLRTGALAADDARRRCDAEGGHLAALETDAERLFVGKNVGVAAWLDGNDAAANDHFVWPDGAPVDPTAFVGGKPNDRDGARGCLMLNAGDKYSDASCRETHAYICEFD